MRDTIIMENEEWTQLHEALDRAFDHSDDYNQKVFILAAQTIIQEQRERIEHMEGVLDGTLWSPRNWNK